MKRTSLFHEDDVFRSKKRLESCVRRTKFFRRKFKFCVRRRRRKRLFLKTWGSSLTFSKRRKTDGRVTPPTTTPCSRKFSRWQPRLRGVFHPQVGCL